MYALIFEKAENTNGQLSKPEIKHVHMRVLTHIRSIIIINVYIFFWY